MKLLLKTLLQRRARDEGFTLPMVIALGLVMLLLGAVSITTANEENITAITQNSRSDALAIAEVGVARYRELLDRNRVLAVYDSAQWGTRTDICDSNLTPQPIIDSQDLDNDGDSSDSIGSYSLVSYDYTNNAATPVANGAFNLTNDKANSDARGILTVKGTASDGSEAQIQVDIPIHINLDDMTNLAPALWIGNSGITAANLGTLTIGNDSDGEVDSEDDGNINNDNGNVVIRDQASADGCSGFSTLVSTTSRRPVISDSRDLPSIQKVIDDVQNASNVTGGDRTNALPSPSGGTVTFGSTTDKAYNPDIPPDQFNVPVPNVDPITGNPNPNAGDPRNCANIKLCRYYYDPPTATTAYPGTSNTNLLTDGIAKTTLLLDQPLSIDATSQDVKIGSTSPIANDSNGFEIYIKDNDTDVTNGSTNSITINVASGRTVTINGFIHAPQSTLTITGNGIVNINGSVWVNDFVNTTATVNISPDTISRLPTPDNSATSGKGYEFYSTTASRTARPITGSPTNWKTEEVN